MPHFILLAGAIQGQHTPTTPSSTTPKPRALNLSESKEDKNPTGSHWFKTAVIFFNLSRNRYKA